VIAHADSLTDEKLLAVKGAIRTGLAEAGIDFGVFEPAKKPVSVVSKRQTKFAAPNGDTHENGSGAEAYSDEEEDTEDRPARAVIKLRPSRHRNPSRSRSRRDLSQVAEHGRRPVTPDASDIDCVANVRFSAHIVAKDLTELLPFALIAPEGGKRRQRPVTPDSHSVSMSLRDQSEDDHASPVDVVPQTPASIQSARTPYFQGPPEDLKGVFIRKYRWGTVDVLDPNHCDFAALRTAVLSTHIKLLKTHTKEVLYEKYRTEKLLARRATRYITDEEKQRLLEDLGL
jgi:hypothetical protein